MKSFLYTLTIVVFLLSAQAAHAQRKNADSSALLEQKVKLEDLITRRLKSTIATTLDKDSFDVSVQVTLVEVAKPKVMTEIRASRKQASEFPLDLTLGLIDVEQVIQKYEDQMKELKDRQFLLSQQKEETPVFLVRSMSVYVGLQPQFGEEYSKELEKWLKETLVKDFGTLATAQVSLIKTAPEKVKEPKTYLDYLLEFQSLLGYLLIALTAILGLLLYKFLGSKDATENRKLSAQLQQNMRMDQERRDVIPEATPAGEIPDKDLVVLELAQFRELQSKILWSASENVTQLTEVFHGWLETGERGFYKTASLMDVLISAGGKQELNQRNPQLQWEMAIPEIYRKKMRGIFEAMSNLELKDHLEILEEIYWDLVSLKTLGTNYLVQPFQFVAAMPAPEMKAMLLNQNPQMKTLIVLHMPEEARGLILSQMSYENKKEIVEQSLQMEKVLVTDIETASETLKYEIKKVGGGANTVSIKSMAPKLLGSMAVREEIQLLSEVIYKLSDGGLSLKQSFPTLAFIDEWPQDKAKTVLTSATSDEILALLRVLPKKQQSLLPLCAPRVQAILADDLNKEDQMSEEAKEKNLSSLKLKMLQIINRNAISLEEIFPSMDKSSGGLRVAS